MNVEFKPCPFCGSNNLVLESDTMFYKLQKENESACLSIDCYNCRVTMWEHSNDIKDYETRVKMLADKWNRRAKNTKLKGGAF